ncbi:SDR family NAD(P)-dependent oxidoreductase [Neorhodopirellula lusitana]|uniref:SDR family NAD(P)-dependent oxidoreductase n=1 Tax=Neorhodopirellula lusitana TaxID=445327 RepID=UPI00384F82F9
MSSTSERMSKLSPQKLALLKKAMGEKDGIAEPIAIVGMGCRFAGAENVSQYWDLIQRGIDMTGDIPESRWDIDRFFEAGGAKPGKMSTRWGGFLENIDRFDATFFGVSPREAEKMDPQHRLLLQVVWEALEYGGIAPSSLRESATGVFIGVGGTDYSRVPVQLDNYYEQITAYSGTGNALSIAANRISYALDLRGPSLAIDTACSSSLVAAHLAIRSLRSKECDAAIVGGVNAILTPETTLAFSQAQMLSPDGKCRPFDDGANGYVRGEGCGAVVLKRLSDAVSDGDLVLATIRGSAVNQDGLTSGINAPRASAQVEVIRRALKDAKCTPDDVSYIEAHGTATPLGDPIELSALTEVFRAGKSSRAGTCYFGSVKANIGHTETAAGIASLIKATLMFQHGTIPAQTHFQKLNHNADLGKSRLHVAENRMTWSDLTKKPIAGVSSFGFGGTNAHLVLEGTLVAKSAKATDQPVRSANGRRHLMTLSAKTAKQLQSMAMRLSDSIAEPGTFPIADACYTAAVGRSAFRQRVAIAATDTADLMKSLESFVDGQTSSKIKQGSVKASGRRKVAFLFPGQGAQAVGMGRELFESNHIFREAIESCDEILADLLPQRLLHVLYHDSSDQPLIHQTQYTQPALFAVEYAMSRMWRSLGVEPAVMMGHSIGDYVAACEAGVFSLEDGLKLISHRGRLVQSLPNNGSMAVVFADRETVLAAIEPYPDQVSLAAHNGPESTVIAGRKSIVDELLQWFETAGVKTKTLEVSHAMHSPLLEPILDEFEQLASEVTFHSPKLPLISSCDGRKLDDRVCQPAYWRNHLRQTVCFVDATMTLQSFNVDAAIEVGPGTTLCGMASRMWDSEPIAWLPSLRTGRADWDVITDSVAELFVRGVKVDWKSFQQPYQPKRIVLPTYPFDSQSYWYDMSRKQDRHVGTMVSSKRNGHPLVGGPIAIAGDKTVFEQLLDARHPEFLADHCLDQVPVVPAAAYMEQALAIAKELFANPERDPNSTESGPTASGTHSLSNLTIEQPLVLAGDNQRVVQMHIGVDLRGERGFEIYSRASMASRNTDAGEASDSWLLHASGTMHANIPMDPSATKLDRQEIQDRMTFQIDGESFYQRIAECGLQYGPMFQVLSSLSSGPGECLCQMQLSEALRNDLAGYVMHPAVMDGCLQSIAGVVLESADDAITDLMLPTQAEQVRVYSDLPVGPLWIHTQRKQGQAGSDTFDANIVLYDDDGKMIAEITGARVQRISKRPSSSQQKPEDFLYQTRWQSLPIPVESRPSLPNDQRWVIFKDENGFAELLVKNLTTQHHVSSDQVCFVQPAIEYSFHCNKEIGGNTICEIRPDELTDYELLFDDLVAQSTSPISVVDLRGVTLADISPSDVDQAGLADEYCTGALLLWRSLAKVAKIKVNGILVVTLGANVVLELDFISPSQTSLWGMARTAMVEFPHLSSRLIDLDSALPSQKSVDVLLNELVLGGVATGETEDSVVEDHVAYRAGDRYVARLEAVPELLQGQGHTARQSVPSSERFALRLGASSSFDELHYEPVGPRTLEPNEVEIAVRSTGLNFSDVLKALGLYPGIKDEIVPLGIECAGVVSRIGDKVDRFEVGQRVMGVAPYSFASHTTTADYAIVEIPDGLSDEEAATIPIVFLTAHHALHALARLRANERVLIHAGAGGVGLAAIQIAQAVGAEIFATAGSDTKRDYLRSLGVQHVMDSRSLDFADQILEITSGYGVDVVLNSLPGEAITKSLSILAAYGRFLEIGKTDIYQNRRIGLLPFQDNLSYHAIDLDRMLRQRPDEIRSLYEEVGKQFERGVYRPLPLTLFGAEEIVDAFRYMSQRKNIGKVVVSMGGQESGSESQDTSNTKSSSASFASGGTVLITGGLGAIGIQVAEYAISQGAKYLAVLTRRSPTDVGALPEQFDHAGVSVTVIQGDVGDRDSLRDALAQLPKAYPPIRGVFHAAGVLQDGLMQTMDLDQLRRVMAPKTQGAWNLHQALTDSLDFFVLFSSVSGTIGSPGQANYAAGNAFLDGLASLRHRLGQPATSIAWGPWDADGMAATPDVKKQLAERGMSPLVPAVAINLLGQSIHSEATQFAVMDVDWDVLLSKLYGGGSSLLHSFAMGTAKSDGGGGAGGTRDEPLYQQLVAATVEERLSLLQAVVSKELGDVMGIEAEAIEIEQPLVNLGMDSLMGMELKAKLEAKLGIEIPMSSLFDDPSVLSLAQVANLSYEADSSGSSPSPSTVQAGTDDAGLVVKSAGRSDVRSRQGLVTLGGARVEGVPIFCLHPVGGDLRCYDALARTIKDRPLFGLRSQGLHAGSTPHANMDSLVDDYIKVIREEWPEGPYCLLGWSTGGIFAYEIARRLHELQLPVQPLIMVDTPLPVVFENVDQGDDAKFLVDLVEFANHFAGTTMQIRYEDLNRVSEQEAIDSVLKLSIDHGVLPVQTTPEYLRRLINVCKNHVSVLQGYQTPKSEFPVEMLRPESTAVLSDATGHSLATDLGWGEFIPLRLHQTPGNHFTMMTQPHVVEMAGIVRELLGEPSLPTV